MKMNVEIRSIFYQPFILETLCWLQFSLTAYHSLYHSSESTNFHSNAVPSDEQSPLGAIEKRQEDWRNEQVGVIVRGFQLQSVHRW